MWGWGFFETTLGSMCIFLIIILGASVPEYLDAAVVIPLFLTAAIYIAHGVIYMKTADRIRKLEEFKELMGISPAALENARQANIYPNEPAEKPAQEPDIIAKFNALDPQSRRVVESVIEAESKRSAE